MIDPIKHLLQKNLLFFLLFFVVIMLFSLYLSFGIGEKEKNTPLQPPFVSQLTPTPFTISPTIPVENLSPEEQGRIQTEADIKFSSAWEDIYTNYPWYDQLPLQTEDYFVYFDPQKKMFIGKLYPKKESGTPVDQQAAAYKTIVLSALENLGIDTKSYQFDWIITPE